MKKNGLRLWIFILTVVFLTSSTSYVMAAGKVFTDVGENYKEAVDYLVGKEITSGIGDTAFGTKKY